MLLFSIFIMLLLSFQVGIVVQRFLKYSFSFSNAIMVGFLFLLAVFHLIAYPMVQMNGSFFLLFWTYSAVILLMVFLSVWLLVKKETRAALLQYTKDQVFCAGREIPLLLVVMGAGLFTLLISCGYSYRTSDDSFYLPRAMEAISQNSVGIAHGFWWTGVEEHTFPVLIDASTLECWKAYWSFLFAVNPTVFCRNSLTVVIHIVSWCSLIQAFRSVSKYQKNKMASILFLIIYLGFLVLDNWRMNSVAFWTIRYPAQGKSIICSIIYPALIYMCANIVGCGKEAISWKKWMGLAMVFTAGISASIIGVFWPFLCCLCMGLPYLLIYRWKDLHHLLLPLIFACAPVIIYGGITLLSISTESTTFYESVTPNWFHTLTGIINTKLLVVLVVCMLFTMVKGSVNAKLVLVGGCVTMLATILNPLLTNFVSTYLTSGGVYYRLFWMIPVYFGIAYAVAELYSGLELKVRQMSAGIAVAILILVGSVGILRYGAVGLYNIINQRANITLDGERRTNMYGLSDLWYQMGTKMLADTDEMQRVRVIWLSEQDCMLRQYSERIELIGACRKSQWVHFDQPLEEGAVAPLELQQAFLHSGGDFEDLVWAYGQLVASGIDYLCVDESAGFAERSLVPEGFELFLQRDGLVIYRIVK